MMNDDILDSSSLTKTTTANTTKNTTNIASNIMDNEFWDEKTINTLKSESQTCIFDDEKLNIGNSSDDSTILSATTIGITNEASSNLPPLPATNASVSASSDDYLNKKSSINYPNNKPIVSKPYENRDRDTRTRSGSGVLDFLWNIFSGPDQSELAQKPSTGTQFVISDLSNSSTVSGNQSNNSSESSQTRPRTHVNMRRGFSGTVVSEIPYSENSWLNGLALVVWSNMEGPITLKFWKGSGNVSSEALNSIGRRMLAGCLDQNVHTKLLVLHEIKIVVLGVTFTASYNGNDCVYAFCLLFAKENLSTYLPLHPVVEDNFLHLTTKLKLLLDKSLPLALDRIGKESETIIYNLDCVFKAGIRRTNIASCFSFLLSQVGPEFISRALTSHFQTLGCSVISGTDQNLCNAFVDFLSFFVEENERKKISYCVQDRLYIPSLLLQGVLMSNPFVSEQQLLESLYPTTWIDTEKLSVKQTHLMHEFTVLRRKYLSQDIERCVTGSYRKSLAQEGFLRPIRAISPVITNIINETFHMPSSLWEAHFFNHINLLRRTAICLIKYVECATVSRDSRAVVWTNKLRENLSLHDDADFWVLLSLAEKLKGGVFFSVAGDPTTIEEMVYELFDGLV